MLSLPAIRAMLREEPVCLAACFRRYVSGHAFEDTFITPLAYRTSSLKPFTSLLSITLLVYRISVGKLPYLYHTGRIKPVAKTSFVP